MKALPATLGLAALALAMACAAPRAEVTQPAVAPSPATVVAPADEAARAHVRATIEGGLLPLAMVKGTPPRRLVDRMKHFLIPGVSVAVIRKRELAWALAYGVRDAGRAEPVTPTTLFQAGSISKPVAALAAMRLVQEGALSLDEDVERRLVSWKLPASEHTKTEKVTLRRLLSHTAGTTVHGFGGYQAGMRVPTVLEVLDGREPANSGAIRVEAVPGRAMKYSGGGFTIMQLLMTDTTRQVFPELMRAKVLAPLGLSRSTYEQPLPAALEGDAAAAHVDGAPLDGKWRVHPELAAAGLWTTPTDLARVLLELQNALDGRSPLLSQALAREMLSPQQGGFGLGFGVEGTGANARFFHGGVNEGFEAYFVAYPARGEGLVVMTNGNGGSRLAKEIIRAVARDDGWPDYAPIEHAPFPVDAATLRACEGAFEVTIQETAPGADKKSGDKGRKERFLLESDGTGLVLRAKGDRPQRWLPLSEGRFFTEDSETTLEMVKTAGAVTGLVIRQDGRAYTGKRAE